VGDILKIPSFQGFDLLYFSMIIAFSNSFVSRGKIQKEKSSDDISSVKESDLKITIRTFEFLSKNERIV